ncbi:glycoside hydrolase family 31 protein [Saccharothrix variisporea]|uniref:Alpha-D-xyloside xylohydrolase n=1 Tax=Saccharothrix variisporea TaxID=543527 RepID=A0A495X146_9PSEU|nr:TIM-barrel domain-containing protein [Saccharothrix variisporea]RKT67216.1 alpha-D-xyloside xylohydrolase [Saccharothrix variisporea]
MPAFVRDAGGLELRTPQEVLWIEPWGPDAVRVRAAVDAIDPDLPGVLDAVAPPAPEVEQVLLGDGSARLVNGKLAVEVDPSGKIRFVHAVTGRELLAEKLPHIAYTGPRVFSPRADGGYQLQQYFAAYDDERIFGLGQNPNGRLDQKGVVVDLVQANTTAPIPFLHSSRGYGLLWHNPALGRVELGADTTRWVADSTTQLDYWIIAGDTPADITAGYVDVTGHPPLLPEWASGFWQSKLRYRDQEELLAVAREYARRGLPLSVIVCDFFHWPHMGDWRFEPDEWPDPAAMVAELESLGVKLAVSVWPTVEPSSDNHDALRTDGLLVRDAHGGLLTAHLPSREPGPAYQPMAHYDATHPDARRLLWQELREHYHAHGISLFWLDACEPDVPPHLAARAVYAAGPGAQVANLYPLLHAQGVADGLRSVGEDRLLTLIRSAWAGSQRHGAALWSGDIPTTFASLATQVRAGLNVALSGIPWWNTDIGGFHGGDPDDPAYREVLVRWFQYGTFSPIMRLHGDRAPNQPFSTSMSGNVNEVWSYGEEAYEILVAHLRLRERLRPYLAELSEAAHRTGAPPMRPLFFDFPDDERAWAVEDQFLLGPDVLVAPVTEAGVRSRPVYLPAGTRWRDAETGAGHDGGTTAEAAAPLSRIPVFVREGAAVAEAFTA